MQRTAYRNGIIYTADSKCPVAEAFAVEDEHFVYVGDNEGLPDCTEQIDLGGACVIPGLIDTHCHMLAGVVQASTHMIFVDPETTPEELGDSIISKLETEYIPEDTTVICMGIDLTVGAFFAKNIDSSIADRPVMVFSNDGHHALSQLGDVVGGNLYPVSLFVLTVDVHIVSVADGDINHNAALWPDVVSCLAQHKKQGTGVGTDATGRLQVQKFDGLLLVDAVVHALHLIIHFSTDGTILHGQSCLLKNLLQIATDRHIHCLSCVAANNSNALFSHSIMRY